MCPAELRPWIEPGGARPAQSGHVPREDHVSTETRPMFARPREQRVVQFRAEARAAVVGVDAHPLGPRLVPGEQHALTDTRDVVAGVGDERPLAIAVARDPLVIDVRDVIARLAIGPRPASEFHDRLIVLSACLSDVDARTHCARPPSTRLSAGTDRSVHSPASDVPIAPAISSSFASAHISFTFAVPGRVSSASITP